eukprot:2227336-Amphidinium_carterae.1
MGGNEDKCCFTYICLGSLLVWFLAVMVTLEVMAQWLLDNGDILALRQNDSARVHLALGQGLGTVVADTEVERLVWGQRQR